LVWWCWLEILKCALIKISYFDSQLCQFQWTNLNYSKSCRFIYIYIYIYIYDIMFVIMCAPNMWYDKCLSCLYHFLSLSNFISYHISIISCAPNRPLVHVVSLIAKGATLLVTHILNTFFYIFLWIWCYFVGNILRQLMCNQNMQNYINNLYLFCWSLISFKLMVKEVGGFVFTLEKIDKY
jgi:hypothetical protein